MTENNRKNDELILYRLDEIKASVDRTGKKLDDHISEYKHTVHGNGNDGLKTSFGKMKTQIGAMWTIVCAAVLAIVNDYVRRG